MSDGYFVLELDRHPNDWVSANLKRLIKQHGVVRCVKDGREVVEFTRADLKECGIGGLIATLNLMVNPETAGGPDPNPTLIPAEEVLAQLYGERWWEDPELEEFLPYMPVPDHVEVKSKFRTKVRAITKAIAKPKNTAEA